MKKTGRKLLVTFVLLVIVKSSIAQNLEAYKYVVVPEKYDFLNEKNEYRLNELTKFLFQKAGFEAYLENETLPDDAITNPCLVLRSNVLRVNKIFTTKIHYVLYNCKNEIIYTSVEGISKEKSYKTAYNIGLRAAFKPLIASNYTYNASKAMQLHKDAKIQEIERLKKQVKTLKEEKTVVQKPTKKPPVSLISKPEEVTEKHAVIPTYTVTKITNGYSLINTTTNTESYTIHKTQLENVFLVQEKNAIIYQKEANWYLEYYQDNTLKTQKIQLQF